MPFNPDPPSLDIVLIRNVTSACHQFVSQVGLVATENSTPQCSFRDKPVGDGILLKNFRTSSITSPEEAITRALSQITSKFESPPEKPTVIIEFVTTTLGWKDMDELKVGADKLDPLGIPVSNVRILLLCSKSVNRATEEKLSALIKERTRFSLGDGNIETEETAADIILRLLNQMI